MVALVWSVGIVEGVEPMGRPSSKQMSVGGLLVLVAGFALVMSLFRPPAPPDEGEALVLAKAYLTTNNEFDYPRGYWSRAVWSQERGTWIVGFVPHSPKQGGATQAVEVSPDRSCRTASPGLAFFDLW
jgi:hypothetical protein